MTLNEQLLKAHLEDDRKALASLYEDAANKATEKEATYFYLTQALVFALETGAPAQSRIATRLKKAGRF